MRKIVAMLIAVPIYFSATAQSVDRIETQNQPSGGAAINIVLSKYDVGTGDSYFTDASSFLQQGNYNEALTLYGKAAFEFSTVKNYNRYGQAIIKMSDMHYRLGNYKEAEDILLNVAVKNYSKLHSTDGLMNTYGLLGNTLLAQNKYTQSMWFYTQQGILAKRQGNQMSFIESVMGVAQVKIKKKEFSLALRDLRTAEALAKTKSSSKFQAEISEARRTIATKMKVK